MTHSLGAFFLSPRVFCMVVYFSIFVKTKCTLGHKKSSDIIPCFYMYSVITRSTLNRVCMDQSTITVL